MDHDRYGSPLMARQRSNASNSSGESLVLAAARAQVRADASGIGSRRAPNYTAKAAEARLAQAMASQANVDEDVDPTNTRHIPLHQQFMLLMLLCQFPVVFNLKSASL
ncbi:hypothetical protein KP509_02G080500 [Ceratopteris richardii]|uniref:Uncharacterized protein n=1 Tax=Ceratopteris richardii TaxID=49495 RepID=A0A8T2VAV1_CERRI|nr:hypothetical protein KP509_02G080500 [Ceratopteris richardii]